VWLLLTEPDPMLSEMVPKSALTPSSQSIAAVCVSFVPSSVKLALRLTELFTAISAGVTLSEVMLGATLASVSAASSPVADPWTSSSSRTISVTLNVPSSLHLILGVS
jgi:hypothetical protein